MKEKDEGEEIQILENGNRLISDKGVKVTTQDNLILTANKLDYNKEKSILLLSGNVIIDDPNNNIKIETKIELKPFYLNSNFTLSRQNLNFLIDELVFSILNLNLKCQSHFFLLLIHLEKRIHKACLKYNNPHTRK